MSKQLTRRTNPRDTLLDDIAPLVLVGAGAWALGTGALGAEDSGAPSFEKVVEKTAAIIEKYPIPSMAIAGLILLKVLR